MNWKLNGKHYECNDYRIYNMGDPGGWQYGVYQYCPEHKSHCLMRACGTLAECKRYEDKR